MAKNQRWRGLAPKRGEAAIVAAVAALATPDNTENPMQTLTLNINGMTCGGCVKSVNTILQNIDGVSRAEVSLENQNAVIEFNPAKTDAAALIKAVEDGGFDASL